MLTGRLFQLRYTLRGTSYLLHRLGYTPQVPVHRAAERDEAKIAAWRSQTWAEGTRLAAATGAYALKPAQGIIWPDGVAFPPPSADLPRMVPPWPACQT